MKKSETSGSQLEKVLKSGRFAITAELNPPDSGDAEDVYSAAKILAGVCDGINAVDASGANCHMSSMAICALLTHIGYETVYQISCRDRNRIAIQGDILGAVAMGVRNLLCITGDDVSAGDQPEAKAVFDLDSIQLLRMARIMRDERVFLSGRKITSELPLYDWRPKRLAKKIAAGAQFIQTQYCFDTKRFKEYMRQVRDMGLHEKVYILAGVGPLRSAGAAKFMRSKVPGVVIPDVIVERLEKTPKKRQQEEGKKICMEMIQQIREIEGIAGVHIMAYRQEEMVAEIVKESGLLPR